MEDSGEINPHHTTSQIISTLSSSLPSPCSTDSSPPDSLSSKSSLSLPYITSTDSSQLSVDDSETMDTDSEQEEPSSMVSLWQFIRALPPLGEMSVRGLLPIQTRSCPKMTLVLDLDETLVHSFMAPIENPDAVISISNGFDSFKIYCMYRPGMFEFLEIMSRYFELVLFTASHKDYAEQLLNKIDPYRRYLRHRFYRDTCTEVFGCYIKDLRVFGRDLSKILIVDNSIQAFAFQLDNGVPIVSWLGDPHDRELVKVAEFLIPLAEIQDVRPVIREKFRLHRYLAMN